MPIAPDAGESQEEWMHRCVPEMINSGHDQDQAVAACINMWEKADASSSRVEMLKRTLRRYKK